MTMSQRTVSKIDKTIMDNFYKLVHSQQNIRLTAASSTFKILRAMSNKNQAMFNENLNYCVHRLVCGLASSRALARQGYGTLLLELLNTYQISTGRLFQIAQENFGQISKKTELDNLIGHFLLISIILKSGNHKKSSQKNQYLEQINQKLLDLYHCKSYFIMPVSKLSVDYFDQLPSLFQRFYPEILNNKQFFKVNDVLSNSHPDILIKYIEDLMRSLHNHPDQQACVKQIAHIVTRPQLNEDIDVTNRVCRFMLLNSMFKSKKETPQDEVINVDGISKVNRVSIRLISAFRSSYHSSMDHLVSLCKSSQRVEHLETILSFVNRLMTHPNLKLVGPGSDKILTELWPDFNSLFRRHKKLLSKDEDSSELQPITILFLFYALQIVEHGLECKSQLEELLKCCEKEEFWADVLTDQLIAILSATECSPWIRRLCESVFGSLLNHISRTSIDLICDAIRPKPEGGDSEDESCSSDEDDEDEDDDDESGMSIDETDSDEDAQACQRGTENSKDNSVSMDANDENKETDENDIADDMNPDTVVEDDDDVDGEDYLNDEQMMKLDSVIADMFRLNRIRKKDKRNPTFQLRCLDLLKKVLKRKSNSVDDVNCILSTVIPLAINSQRIRETKPVSDKIVKILSKMPGRSKFPELVQFLEKHK